MKFVQVHKLVALCLCLGVLCTRAQNLRPRLLAPDCFVEGDTCTKKRDCCEGLNCVGPRTDDGSKTCEKPGGAGTKNHCIPEGKLCNNGNQPHQCCVGYYCTVHFDGKFRCHSPTRLLAPDCFVEGDTCTQKKDCCEGLNCVGTFSNDGSKTCEKPGAGTQKHCIPVGKWCDNGNDPHNCCSGSCEQRGDEGYTCSPNYDRNMVSCINGMAEEQC